MPPKPLSHSKPQAAEANVRQPVQPPSVRTLRGYAFDPSLSSRLETFGINEVVFKVPWEENLEPGPKGEYLEVIDHDPASQCYYAPVDLNDLRLAAQDGHAPSEGNPQFHQQMVYAVAMNTITNFERALGRKVLWSSHVPDSDKEPGNGHDLAAGYVPRLRVFPHALRQANAYYSPPKKALLFGYFPATREDPRNQLPGGTVFTCLSHDIIAHETTHALLDGLYARLTEPTNRDVLAFHEAFADIVALFQHFTYPDVLKHQIDMTRGDLYRQSLLGQLAQEFGRAIGNYGALRDAIGGLNDQTKEWELHIPDPLDYETVLEPHMRGSILVAAVFDAFLAIYSRRIADLLRIANINPGTQPAMALHPDLTNRLANEASKTAKHILNICIRAVDYCTPIDITFGEYLRALITADSDMVPEDDRSYRIAFIDAFRRRGIFPEHVRTLSAESLSLPTVDSGDIFQEMLAAADSAHRERLESLLYRPTSDDRRRTYLNSKSAAIALHQLIKHLKGPLLKRFEDLTGLILKPTAGRDKLGLEKDADGMYIFEIHTVRRARRTRPDDEILNQVHVTITQRGPLDPKTSPGLDPQGEVFRGGCTLIFDYHENPKLRYVIQKSILEDDRRERQQAFTQDGLIQSLNATYTVEREEPFALLHNR